MSEFSKVMSRRSSKTILKGKIADEWKIPGGSLIESLRLVLDDIITRESGSFEQDNLLFRVSRAKQKVYLTDSEFAAEMSSISSLDLRQQVSKNAIEVGNVVYETAFTSTSLVADSPLLRYSSAEFGGEASTNPDSLQTTQEEEIIFVIHNNGKVPCIDISGYKFSYIDQPTTGFLNPKLLTSEFMRGDEISSSEYLMRSNARFRVVGISTVNPATNRKRRLVALEPLGDQDVKPDDIVRNIYTGAPSRNASVHVYVGQSISLDRPAAQDFDADYQSARIEALSNKREAQRAAERFDTARLDMQAAAQKKEREKLEKQLKESKKSSEPDESESNRNPETAPDASAEPPPNVSNESSESSLQSSSVHPTENNLSAHSSENLQGENHLASSDSGGIQDVGNLQGGTGLQGGAAEGEGAGAVGGEGAQAVEGFAEAETLESLVLL